MSCPDQRWDSTDIVIIHMQNLPTNLRPELSASLRVCLWQVFDAPNDYIAMQLKAIIALVLHFTKLLGVRSCVRTTLWGTGTESLQDRPETSPALGQVLARKNAG
jgi:hypothetical protein